MRFVPYGFKIKFQTSLELVKNPFIIALVDGEGQAEKLAQIADKHKAKPHVWGLRNVKEPLQRVPMIYSYGYGLNIDSGDNDGYKHCLSKDGYAFGRCDYAEAKN